MNINQLIETGKLLDDHSGQTLKSYESGRVGHEADFNGKTKIGWGVYILGRAAIGKACAFGDSAVIGNAVWIGDSVRMDKGAELGEGTIVFEGASIGSNADIQDRAIIGPKAKIPHEAQIGADMVIPTTKAIAVLGRLGDSSRIMTIHGSDDGPRFSAGCQYSDDWEMIHHRIMNAVGTEPSSAEHYQDYLDVIRMIGDIAQRYYEAEATLIADLRGKAADIRGAMR